MRFILLTHLKIPKSNSLYVVWKISRTYSSCMTETSYLLKNNLSSLFPSHCKTTFLFSASMILTTLNTYRSGNTIFVLVWLAYLNNVMSNCCSKWLDLLPLKRLNNIPLCTHTHMHTHTHTHTHTPHEIFFIHLSADICVYYGKQYWSPSDN
jgi:hypothetical protein